MTNNQKKVDSLLDTIIESLNEIVSIEEINSGHHSNTSLFFIAATKPEDTDDTIHLRVNTFSKGKILLKSFAEAIKRDNKIKALFEHAIAHSEMEEVADKLHDLLAMVGDKKESPKEDNALENVSTFLKSDASKN